MATVYRQLWIPVLLFSRSWQIGVNFAFDLSPRSAVNHSRQTICLFSLLLLILSSKHLTGTTPHPQARQQKSVGTYRQFGCLFPWSKDRPDRSPACWRRGQRLAARGRSRPPRRPTRGTPPQCTGGRSPTGCHSEYPANVTKVTTRHYNFKVYINKTITKVILLL